MLFLKSEKPHHHQVFVFTGSKGHFQQFYREYRGANFDDSDEETSSSSGEESGSESEGEEENVPKKNGSDAEDKPMMKPHKSEIDDYLMEFDGKSTQCTGLKFAGSHGRVIL